MNRLRQLFSILLFSALLPVSGLFAQDAIDELFTPEEVANSLTLPEVDDQPQPVRQGAPSVPNNLRSVNGYARVYFLIDENGDIQNARIQRSSDPRFEEPALNAVNSWKFRPAKKGGQAVAVRVILPMRFTAN